MHRQARVPSAAAISERVAFSASLTSTPPKPRNPPSFDASATLLAICSSQALYAAASEDAFWSTMAAAERKRVDGPLLYLFPLGALEAGS